MKAKTKTLSCFLAGMALAANLGFAQAQAAEFEETAGIPDILNNGVVGHEVMTTTEMATIRGLALLLKIQGKNEQGKWKVALRKKHGIYKLRIKGNPPQWAINKALELLP